MTQLISLSLLLWLDLSNIIMSFSLPLYLSLSRSIAPTLSNFSKSQISSYYYPSVFFPFLFHCRNLAVSSFPCLLSLSLSLQFLQLLTLSLLHSLLNFLSPTSLFPFAFDKEIFEKEMSEREEREGEVELQSLKEICGLSFSSLRVRNNLNLNPD